MQKPEVDVILEQMKQHCYLNDVLDSEGSVKRVVRTYLTTTWSRDSRTANKQGYSTEKNIGNVFETCERSASLYGSQIRILTMRLENVVVGYDQGMLRYMTGTTWSIQHRGGKILTEGFEYCAESKEIIVVQVCTEKRG